MKKIEIENLCVSYPILGLDRFSLKKQVANTIIGGKLNLLENGINFVDALTDINLSVNEEEILAIVGHNGSGKTTLLRAICGILHPSKGIVHIRGKISCLIDPGAGLDYEATGRENIFLLSYNAGHENFEIQKALSGIIEFAELGDFIDLPVRTYSLGMIARLAFSVATAFDSDIIVMDEGIAAGDKGFLERASGRIGELYKNASCVVLATHSYEFAKQRCNRIIELRKGSIVQDYSTRNGA